MLSLCKMALLSPSVLHYCAVCFATRSSPLKVFCIQNVLEDLEGPTGYKPGFFPAILPRGTYVCLIKVCQSLVAF